MLQRLNPPQIVVLSFLFIITCGTILLSLPCAAQTGLKTPLIDAFFTATSATCVTGLIVRDTGSYFSLFGQVVILVLFQIGGLGIMSLSTFFAVLLGKKLTIRQNIVVQSALDHHTVEKLPQLVVSILALTFGLETLGAGLLFLKIRLLPGMTLFKAWYYSFFHSISAFCNAGFSLYSNSFIGFQQDVFVNLVIIFLIISGGLGFVVLMDLPKIVYLKNGKFFLLSKISLQSKIVIIATAVLLLAGTIVFFALEKNGVLHNLSLGNKWLASFFQAVTPRTAGFNTLPIDRMTDTALFFIILLMFIGASPGSTGGGIKTATAAVLFATVMAMMKNREEVSIFGKTIPRTIIRRAIVVFMLALVWIIAVVCLLNITEAGAFGGRGFLRILFEIISAFGTVGLSTGITPYLSAAGRLLICLTIFVGRVGLLTAVLAVALKEERPYVSFPEERIMVG